MFQLYDIHGPLHAIPDPTAVTVGVFDGVHRGHQALIHQLSTLNAQLSTLVVTLTSHPSFVLGRRQSEYWLDDPEEHLRLLFAAGAHYVAVLPFTAEVAQLSACAMARLLCDQLNMRALLLGYDSRFGSKQNDDFDRLPLLASELGFSLHRGEPYQVEGSPISSSRIRETLERGAVDETSTLLGRPFAVTGAVQHGRGVGHTLGFPTANIDLSQTRKMLPKEGVYAVKLSTHVGMANLGAAPTFGIDQPTLEVHLLDFHGDLYGQTVNVEFLHRLRDIEHFSTPEALQQQLQKDLEQTRLWS
ncbi:MAG: riboflavin biosynthesis protein RibF [Bacteroidales bacterium]|nr:riboflavin biosynthesis protein RibF [Bacteroidales bacterium]